MQELAISSGGAVDTEPVVRVFLRSAQTAVRSPIQKGTRGRGAVRCARVPLKTGYVQKELRRVLNVAEYQPEGRIFVIPVRLEPCRVPEQLSHWQYADLFLENGYERLRETLTARAGVASPTVSDRDLTTPEQRPPQEQRPAKQRRLRSIPLAIGALIAAAAAVAFVWWRLHPHRTDLVVHNGNLQVFTTPGAEVRVDGRTLGLADNHGVLTVRGLTATEHQIRVDRPGFMQQQQTVHVVPT